MRKSLTLISLLIMLSAAGEPPQSRSAKFNEFRSRAINDFQSFRKRVLEHYADFLNGEWHEFEAILEEDSPYTQPKLDSIPEYFASAEELETNIMMRLPDAVIADQALPGLSDIAYGDSLSNTNEKEAEETFKPIKINIPGGMSNASGPKTKVQGLAKMFFVPADAEGKTNYELAAMKIPDPNFAFGPFPGQIRAPQPGQVGVTNSEEEKADNQSTVGSGAKNFHFDFYGMDAFIPEVDFSIASTIQSTNETGSNWAKMAEQKGGIETARQLFGLAQELGLNGYLTFRLAESYVNQRFPQSNDKARISAVHFLLSNMGYDVRLSTLGDTFTVLMPFDQKVVYGLFPQTINNRKYYAMFPQGFKKPKAGTPMRMSTCELPGDALGKTSDLRLTGLNLPMKPKEFEISRNGLTIKGVVNENIQALLYEYPQMPAGDFASSWIDQQLRDDIVAQLKSQMEGMTETQAINTLMSLCHYGFKYATDQDNHGFEKPYFLEENFIYDKNDCEDRAIFFSYLVWNALGLPCQLIQYPGHESVSIAATSDIQGCYYDTDGTKYYSSDPTYCGSRIGQVMPALKTATPSIDKHYR